MLPAELPINVTSVRVGLDDDRDVTDAETDEVAGDEDDEEAREGIFSHLAQMGETELRELYGGYLVPKGYREKDIMEMPMKELEYLFNQVMGT